MLLSGSQHGASSRGEREQWLVWVFSRDGNAFYKTVFFPASGSLSDSAHSLPGLCKVKASIGFHSGVKLFLWGMGWEVNSHEIVVLLQEARAPVPTH